MNLSTYRNENVILYHAEVHKMSVSAVEELFSELKDFLSGCSGHGKSPSKEVDQIWHSFILHTAEYARFCEVFFNRFIHHKPASRYKMAGMNSAAILNGVDDCDEE